jgi:hypothetical protein
MIIEIVHYRTMPGKGSKSLEIFHSKTLPAHREIGMNVSVPFHSMEDPETSLWMRGFPDLSSREPLKAKFYEGKLLKKGREGVLFARLKS